MIATDFFEDFFHTIKNYRLHDDNTRSARDINNALAIVVAEWSKIWKLKVRALCEVLIDSLTLDENVIIFYASAHLLHSSRIIFLRSINVFNNNYTPGVRVKFRSSIAMSKPNNSLFLWFLDENELFRFW